MGAVLRRRLGVVRRRERRVMAALAVATTVGVVITATPVAGLLRRSRRVAPPARVLLGRAGSERSQGEQEDEGAAPNEVRTELRLSEVINFS